MPMNYIMVRVGGVILNVINVRNHVRKGLHSAIRVIVIHRINKIISPIVTVIQYTCEEH